MYCPPAPSDQTLGGTKAVGQRHALLWFNNRGIARFVRQPAPRLLSSDRVTYLPVPGSLEIRSCIPMHPTIHRADYRRYLRADRIVPAP
jgi:hypothetical protein